MFNEAHYHIAVNHLPVVGFMGALVLAIVGLFVRDRMLHLTAWMFTLVSAIFGVLAYLSGGEAEEMMEDAAGVSGAYLSAHERWGEWTFYACLGVIAVSIIGWILTYRRKNASVMAIFLLSALLLVANGMGTVTATLGGGIRHPEAHADQFGKIMMRLGMIPEEQAMVEEEPAWVPADSHESGEGQVDVD